MNTSLLGKQSPPDMASPRRTHMQEWLENLQSVVKDNEQLTADLEARLQRVCRAQAPVNPGTQAGAPQEYLVPLADAIRDAVRAIERNNEGLRDMLGRLEA